MRHFCKAIILVMILCSCASKQWVDISDRIEVNSLMQQKFPALYDRYKSGKLIICKVEQRTDDKGKIHYRITHKDKYEDSDEILLWQTIFMPLLND